LNGRDHFWNGTQLAEFVDTIGCQDCLIIHVFLTNADPAQLVTDYPDIFFSGLHNGRYYFIYDTIKGCFLKTRVFFYYFKKKSKNDFYHAAVFQN
jgi:hypothetical protein